MHQATGRRHGAAPIELVMSIPVIVLLCALMWTLAFSGIDRCWVLTQARSGPWKSRDNPAANKDKAVSVTVKHSSPLQLAGMLNTQQGKLTGEAHLTVRSAKIFGKQRETVAGSAFLTGTWDHRQAPFNGSKMPHFKILQQMSVGEPGGVQQLTGIGKLLSFSSTSDADVIAALDQGNDMQAANEKLKIEKLKEKIAEYTKMIASLGKEILDLEADLDDIKETIKNPLKKARELRKIRNKLDEKRKLLGKYRQGLKDAQNGLNS